MKSLILWAFALCAFGGEVMIDRKESFRNNAYSGGGEFSRNSQNSQILENSNPAGHKQNLENSKNSSGEILVKKYKKWEDLENEWEEKWQRDEGGVAKMYEDLSKGKNE